MAISSAAPSLSGGVIGATTGFQGPYLDTASAGALTIGPTNATSIVLSQNTSMSGASTFATGTGTVSLNGSAVFAANKNLSCLAGSTAVDLSAGTGTFKTTTGLHTFNGKLAAGAATNTIADPGDAQAIPVTSSGMVALAVGAAGQTNTLAIPTFVDQELGLVVDTTAGGTRVVTVAQAINQVGNNTITLNGARDYVLLRGINVSGALRWQVIATDGAALSTV